MAPEWIQYYQLKDNYQSVYSSNSMLEIWSGSFNNNNPSAGSVAWDKIKVKYNGSIHTITNSNTSDSYVYWEPTDPKVFSSTNILPTVSQYLFIIGYNQDGTFQTLWRPEDLQTRVLLGLSSDGTVNADKVNADSITEGTITEDIGDPPASHFSINLPSLNWTDLDCSEYLPSGHRTIIFRCYGQTAADAGNYKFIMRTKGNSFTYNIAEYPPGTAGGYSHAGGSQVALGRSDMVVRADSDGFVQYASFTPRWNYIWLLVAMTLP
jgi:hypothetical protein